MPISPYEDYLLKHQIGVRLITLQGDFCQNPKCGAKGVLLVLDESQRGRHRPWSFYANLSDRELVTYLQLLCRRCNSAQGGRSRHHQRSESTLLNGGSRESDETKSNDSRTIPESKPSPTIERKKIRSEESEEDEEEEGVRDPDSDVEEEVHEDIDHTEGGFEAKKSTYSGLRFRRWLRRKMKQWTLYGFVEINGEIFDLLPKKEAIGSGSEYSHCDVQTGRRYLERLISAEGPYKESKNKRGKKFIVPKDHVYKAWRDKYPQEVSGSEVKDSPSRTSPNPEKPASKPPEKTSPEENGVQASKEDHEKNKKSTETQVLPTSVKTSKIPETEPSLIDEKKPELPKVSDDKKETKSQSESESISPAQKGKTPSRIGFRRWKLTNLLGGTTAEFLLFDVSENPYRKLEGGLSYKSGSKETWWSLRYDGIDVDGSDLTQLASKIPKDHVLGTVLVEALHEKRFLEK